jgi:hypothetical protein
MTLLTDMNTSCHELKRTGETHPLSAILLLQKLKRMAKQKFRPARLGGFSGAKAYIRYVEVLKKHRNAAGRTFCDAIKMRL